MFQQEVSEQRTDRRQEEFVETVFVPGAGDDADVSVAWGAGVTQVWSLTQFYYVDF